MVRRRCRRIQGVANLRLHALKPGRPKPPGSKVMGRGLADEKVLQGREGEVWRARHENEVSGEAGGIAEDEGAKELGHVSLLSARGGISPRRRITKPWKLCDRK